MYPNNNISQTISDLSFVDYGSSSGKWRANKKINFDLFSFYGSGLILSGKDYFKKSFGNNSDNKFDDFLVEFYATGNNYEIDFIKNGQTNLSIERTGNSIGGFLLNYRGSSTSFSETGATGFYSFNFKNTGINPIYLFGKASGSLVYHDNRIKTPNGYFGSGVLINAEISYSGVGVRLASINNFGISKFNLDSFSIDFLCKFTGDKSSAFDFLSTRTNSGSVSYPSRNSQDSLTFLKRFDSNSIRLNKYTNDILNIPITSGSWDHIMVTCNKTSGSLSTLYSFSGYKNGILESSNSSYSGGLNWANQLIFSGLDIFKVNFNSLPAVLLLDEIRMWSGAKSSGEVNNLKFTELKSDPLLYNDPNLLYHVSFDEITTQNKNIDFYKNGNLSKTNIINNTYTGYLDYSNIKVTGQCEFDEFRFWSGVRTSGQISEQAKSGIGTNFLTSYSGNVFGKTALGITGGQIVQLPVMEVKIGDVITSSGYFGSGFIPKIGGGYPNNRIAVFSPNFSLESFTIDFLMQDKEINNISYYDTFLETFSNINLIDPSRPGLRIAESITCSYSYDSSYNNNALNFITRDQDPAGNGDTITCISFQKQKNTIFNSWTHTCLTFLKNGSQWYISGYLNGELNDTFSLSTTRLFGQTFNFSGIEFFKGKYGYYGSGPLLIIDEFRLWSGVKSSGEINDLKFKRLSSKQSWMTDPLLLSYAPFDGNNNGIFDYDKLLSYQNSGLYSYPAI